MTSASTQLVDMSHPWRADLWPFVGLPAPSITDFIGGPGKAPRVQQITTNMHVGTHFDAPMHFIANAGDMASISLDQLYHEGVIVDVSDKIKDWDIIYPEHVTDKVDVKDGDIIIFHTGWHHYYKGEREENELKYFCYAPGPDAEMAKWMLKKKIRWFGMDTSSGDHPMNTGLVKKSRPDLVKEFEKKMGKNIEEIFPSSGSSIMHTMLFPHKIIHAENLGGDLDKVLNRRCTIGAFPWNFVGGDACICRIIAFL
ncbi:MAG: cyclase family protein [Nitrososphaerales archaeon]